MAKLGSAGLAPIFSEVRLVDPIGRTIVPPRLNGEIITSGPNIMKGCWNNPEATDPEGWFHTSDVGFFDEEGFLFIADHLKDMIITGGENVYPAEVESALYDHPAINEIAVIGKRRIFDLESDPLRGAGQKTAISALDGGHPSVTESEPTHAVAADPGF